MQSVVTAKSNLAVYSTDYVSFFFYFSKITIYNYYYIMLQARRRRYVCYMNTAKTEAHLQFNIVL